jgi:hypothetical protein
MAAYFKSIDYVPHREQWLYHKSPARFRVACCGRRFGKSVMAARDVTPRHILKPDQMIWFVGPTYFLGEKEFRVVWNDLIVKKKFGRDKRVKRAYNVRTGDMHIHFPWNTRLEVRSAEHSELLVGEGLDHVVMCEAAKHKKETWDRFIRPGLADRRGTADFCTTPEGFNWLYELWGLGRNPELPEYESWRFPSWLNTHVYPGGKDDPEIELLRKTMDAEWFLQEIGADFASFVGKIFPDWDEFASVKPHTFRPDWKNYITFDWGYTNPLAAVEFQVSPTDQIYVWRVYYKSYKTLLDVAAELLTQEQPDGYHVDLCFGDPADPEAVATMARALGIQVYAPKNLKSDYTWMDGINLMRQFMKPDRQVGEDEYGTPEYESSFFVDPRCTPMIKELSNYRSKAPVKGQNVPELGNKVEDHTIDAMRYALLCIFKLGILYSLSDVMDLTPMAVPYGERPVGWERDSALVTSGQPDVLGGSFFGTGSGGIFSRDMDF